MHERDPAKRIPKSLGTDAKLFGNYTLSDVAVALAPGVLVILAMQVVLPADLTVGGYQVQSITLPLAGVAMSVGAVFVYLTPNYTTSADWLGTFAGFYRSSQQLPHDDAKQYTQVERVHPERGAIERSDGAFLGMVEVTPPTMALATDAEWAQKTAAFRDFLNTAVESPIQIYSTTRAFPVEEYLAHYESRLGDADVKANAHLTALIENYVAWYEYELTERRMTIRDHYVVVPVTPGEVQFEHESLVQQLAALPVLGVFVEAWLAPPVEEQREAMFDALDERLRRVTNGLREIDGCNASRLTATDATRLITEFWAGDNVEYDTMARALRTRPLVGGQEA